MLNRYPIPLFFSWGSYQIHLGNIFVIYAVSTRYISLFILLSPMPPGGGERELLLANHFLNNRRRTRLLASSHLKITRDIDVHSSLPLLLAHGLNWNCAAKRTTYNKGIASIYDAAILSTPLSDIFV